MPEVRGFYENNVSKNSRRYRHIKLTKEIEELYGLDYELIYDFFIKTYRLAFKYENRIYFIQTTNYSLKKGNRVSDLWEYNKIGNVFLNRNHLGSEIYYLISNFKNIILNHSSERLKYLVNN